MRDKYIIPILQLKGEHFSILYHNTEGQDVTWPDSNVSLARHLVTWAGRVGLYHE